MPPIVSAKGVERGARQITEAMEKQENTEWELNWRRA
jgi:hypothetical protein